LVRRACQRTHRPRRLTRRRWGCLSGAPSWQAGERRRAFCPARHLARRRTRPRRAGEPPRAHLVLSLGP
jgi:hypothetical protein